MAVNSDKMDDHKILQMVVRKRPLMVVMSGWRQTLETMPVQTVLVLSICYHWLVVLSGFVEGTMEMEHIGVMR